MIIVVDLAYPPSMNRLWRSNFNTKKVYRDPKYVSWMKQAHLQWLIQKPKGFQTIPGDFKASIYAVRPDKRTRDLDNLFKPMMDFAQSARLVANDGNCIGLRIRWASTEEAPDGARLVIEGV